MKPMANTATIYRFAKNLLAAGGIVASRLNMLPANVSPVGSFGFFGNPVWYIASVVAFDLFFGGLYRGFWFTYLGFAMYPLMGWLARSRTMNGAAAHSQQLRKAWLLLPTASLLFFLISNFGSWYYFYPRTLEGLLLCYTFAIPFYSRTLIGDVVFGYGYLVLKQERVQQAISATINKFLNTQKYSQQSK